MKARRILDAWWAWLRWRYCWDSDVAERVLRRDVDARNPWGLS